MAENDKIKKRHWFGRKMLTLIATIGASIGLFCMILCAINPLISPDSFVFTSFFGLTFWPILLFNILVLIALLVLKTRWQLVIPVVAIIIAIPGLLRSFTISSSKSEQGSIKIMSYNVGNYWDIVDNQREPKDVKNDIIEIIKSQNPDIVCLQESGHWNDNNAKEFAEKINLKYYKFSTKITNVIFSKFPLNDDDFTKSFNYKNDISTIALADAGELGSFYIECVHLQSFMISKEEIEYLNDAKNYVENSETMGKSVLFKLKDGFEKRTEHTKKLVENLPDTGIPIIICGDFNDTPLSYTYHQLRKAGLNDAFLEVGNGIGKTYCGKLPMLRIDYFWHSENIVPMTFDRVTRKLSDHYPIIMTFNVTH